MRILFIGDIVGRPGRSALKRALPELRRTLSPDFVIANGENAAGGSGITESTLNDILRAGVDVVTGGNHSFHHREALTLADSEPRLLRPANYPPGVSIPGRGSGVFKTENGRRVGVFNLCGRVNIGQYEDPFPAARRIAAELREQTPITLLDFHAEVTSEKIALGWYVDGHVSAVVGTHTHVQTADERVLPGGTAHICDVGMTGPHDSVLGVEKEIIIQRFLDQLPARFEIAKGDVRINGVLIDVDDKTGRANSISRVSEPVEL